MRPDAALSPRRATYFSLLRQRNLRKRKATRSLVSFWGQSPNSPSLRLALRVRCYASQRNWCLTPITQSWGGRQRQLYKHDWVVYAKTPLGGPAQVLEYLSRYTHRTAISNERIRSINAQEVAFSVRADDHGGKRLVRLDGPEFVRRFMLHILPTGIKRIRHYGVLASSCKGVKLAAARVALPMPLSNPQASESAHAFMARVAKMDVLLCPCCRQGRLHVTAVLAGLGRLPAPASSFLPTCRGPP